MTYTVLADVGATVVTKLPGYTVVLLELLGRAGLVLEALDGDLGGETIVGSKRSLAAVAMAKCGSRIVKGIKL